MPNKRNIPDTCLNLPIGFFFPAMYNQDTFLGGVIYIETKKALAASLKETMRHKAFSKITVKEIIQSCGVNRNTFYYHFEDIYSLLRWMLTEEAIDVVKHFNLFVYY